MVKKRKKKEGWKLPEELEGSSFSWEGVVAAAALLKARPSVPGAESNADYEQMGQADLTHTKSRLLPLCCTSSPSLHLLSPLLHLSFILPPPPTNPPPILFYPLIGHCWFIQCHAAQTSIHQKVLSTGTQRRLEFHQSIRSENGNL